MTPLTRTRSSSPGSPAPSAKRQKTTGEKTEPAKARGPDVTLLTSDLPDDLAGAHAEILKLRARLAASERKRRDLQKFHDDTKARQAAAKLEGEASAARWEKRLDWLSEHYRCGNIDKKRAYDVLGRDYTDDWSDVEEAFLQYVDEGNLEMTEKQYRDFRDGEEYDKREELGSDDYKFEATGTDDERGYAPS